jgi:hypothetical protein
MLELLRDQHGYIVIGNKHIEMAAARSANPGPLRKLRSAYNRCSGVAPPFVA